MITSEQKKFFDEQGYLVVEDVLRGQLLEDVRRESHALFAGEPASKAMRVWHERALFRRKAFRDVMFEPKLTHTAEALIGDDVQLLAIDLKIDRKGTGSVAWHRDVTFWCDKTLSMNTGIYLYDMDESMGPLRVVPRTHHNGEPPGKHPRAGEVIVPVKAGTAVFFDAALLHSASPNTADRHRMGLFAYFGRYFIKRMDDYYTQALPAELLQTKDPLVRQLLGFELRKGVAHYDGDCPEYNLRGEPGIDYVIEDK